MILDIPNFQGVLSLMILVNGILIKKILGVEYHWLIEKVYKNIKKTYHSVALIFSQALLFHSKKVFAK